MSGSGAAPGRSCRFALKVPWRRPSGKKAAEARLSIECGPGMGPSASMSVLT
ncbi:MAG: hypothetical protein R3F14_10340 [Polyangiaceae bacterium]